jgi:hypothetical protein
MTKQREKGTERDLGALGESVLRNWCAQVGITANKSEIDTKGWDFILQFPPKAGAEEISLGSADLKPPELTCFAQVKATDSSKRGISIPLSHWKRHVDVPLPAFFLVIDFAGANSPLRAYLVEVDRSWAEKVLKRLRQVTEDELDLLHKKTLQLKWTDADSLVDLNGTGLSKKIHEKIGTNLAKYTTDKISWSRTIGYEQRPYHVSVMFKVDDLEEHYKQLVSFALGDVSSLAVESIYAEEVRFGIPKKLRRPDIKGTGASLTVQNLPSLDVTFKISDRSNQRVVTLPAKMFVPGFLFPFIPRKFWRMRVVTSYTRFEWIAGVEGGDFSFSLPARDDRMKISDLFKLATLLDLLISSEKEGIKIEVSFPAGAVTFEQGAGLAMNGRVNIETLRSTLMALKTIAKETDIDLNCEVSVGDLLNQKAKLESVQAALRGDPQGAVIKIAKVDLPENYEGGATAVFLNSFIRLDRDILCAFVSFSGPADKIWIEDAKYWELTIKVENIKVHGFSTLEAKALSKFDLKGCMSKYADEFNETMKLILIPQLDSAAKEPV